MGALDLEYLSSGNLSVQLFDYTQVGRQFTPATQAALMQCRTKTFALLSPSTSSACSARARQSGRQRRD